MYDLKSNGPSDSNDTDNVASGQGERLSFLRKYDLKSNGPTPMCKNKLTKTKKLIIFRVRESFSSDTDAAAGAAAGAAATAAASAAAFVFTTVFTVVATVAAAEAAAAAPAAEASVLISFSFSF